MATIEPRVTFTPSPALGPQLRELAGLMGTTPAKLVRSLLDDLAPEMPGMIEALRQAKDHNDQAQASLDRMMQRAQNSIAQTRLDLKRKPGRRKGRGAANTG